MRVERNVGGLRCGEVLELLSLYVDGELGAQERQKVEAHVAACHECARFGTEFGSMVAAVKQRLAGSTSEDSVERVTRATLAVVTGKR